MAVLIAVGWTWLISWLVLALVTWLFLGDESNVTPWGALYWAAATTTFVVPTLFALFLRNGW